MKDKSVKFVVQRSTLCALCIIVALAILAMVVALAIAFLPVRPPTQAQTLTNILNYWNFANCKWQKFYNYNDQNQLVATSTYTTHMRWWTTRCGTSPNDRDPCGTDANYVMWNILGESVNCYPRYSGWNVNLAVYLDKELETLDYTHPVSGTANFTTVAQIGWAEITQGTGWDWSLCGAEDPPDSQCTDTCAATTCAANCGPCGGSGCYGNCADAGGSDCQTYTRFFYGRDGSSVLPGVYSPQSWDFSNGAWYYYTHAAHYTSTTSGSFCGLSRNSENPTRVDYAVFVEHLGSKTFGTTGQYTGNVIRITMFEGGYHLEPGLTPDQRVGWDLVEEWYLMENIGFVEIRQWRYGDHKVTAKLNSWNTNDAYCSCCGAGVCNQCYQS